MSTVESKVIEEGGAAEGCVLFGEDSPTLPDLECVLKMVCGEPSESDLYSVRSVSELVVKGPNDMFYLSRRIAVLSPPFSCRVSALYMMGSTNNMTATNHHL